MPGRGARWQWRHDGFRRMKNAFGLLELRINCRCLGGWHCGNLLLFRSHMFKSLWRLTVLVNDILSFSRDSSGEQQSKWSNRSSRLIEMEDLWTTREKIQLALFKYGVVVESAPAVEDTATTFIEKMSCEASFLPSSPSSKHRI
ncbi:hypothetical protein NC653_007174 [Populus alba x Populus x berolinensis]|uniref:Uncharacterized protein n=1 Tax=Populus alba x Populus x berolinensis TaxID=444605 RepID=A0AAD6WD54_9ROSI|nr:hypothetical protein NC653_007174 [Populus alba x Populus x berolinensis]